MKTIILLIFFLSTKSLALPPALNAFCGMETHTNICAKDVKCELCHVKSGSALNPYGNDVKTALSQLTGYAPTSIESFIETAVTTTYDRDSDADGKSNKLEILSGTLPGDNTSNSDLKTVKPEYNIGLAFQRVSILYCGKKATYEEKLDFEKAPDARAFLHQKLQRCLDSTWWKNVALRKLADPKIKPMKALGAKGSIVLADYEWDYRLFSYVLTGDRDFRDLLLADYHIDQLGNRITEKIKANIPFTIANPTGSGAFIVLGTGQPLEKERRLGMITTQWFLSTNTMFSDIPRTTAAQAMRAYLGQDLAKSEGMHPVQGEPRNVDKKGVKQAECAYCHATLDPLSYTLSNYRGIETNLVELGLSLFTGFSPSGTYDPNRSIYEADGYILGQKVATPYEWASVAANSMEFRKNIVSMFYEHATRKKPETSFEIAEFNQLVNEVPENKFQAEKLIHRLVDMLSFAGVLP